MRVQATRVMASSTSVKGELSVRSRDGHRYELDWLRVVVVLGLIPYHAAVVFAIGPGDYVKSGARSIAFDVGATLVAFVGMPLLFAVAGAATWYALGHRSPLAYLVERVGRLAVPLVFGILALVPIQLYVERLSQPGYHLNYLQFYRLFLVDWAHIARLGVFGRGFQYWGHLWFLLYLLAVSLILLPFLAWLRHGTGQRYSSRVARMAARPHSIVLLGVPFAVVEVLLQGPVGPNPAVDYSNLYSGAAGLVLYAVAFVLGFVLVPDASFQRVVVQYRTHLLALGIMLLVVHELALGAFGISLLRGPLAPPIIRLLRGLISWCLMTSALGFAARYLATGTRRLRSLNEACFPLYVLHMPILTVLAYYVVRWEAPIGVEFVALLILTAIVTFTLYEAIVRRIPPMRFLFGLKPLADQSPSQHPVEASCRLGRGKGAICRAHSSGTALSTTCPCDPEAPTSDTVP